MRTAVTIDEELYAKPFKMADPHTDKASLFRERSEYIKIFVGVTGCETALLHLEARRQTWLTFQRHEADATI